MSLRSIRARTLVRVLGVLALSLTVISWRSYGDAQHEIEELFDAQLAQSARLLAGMVHGQMPESARLALQQSLDGALLARRTAPAMADAQGHKYESKLGFVVFDDDGKGLLQSAGAPLEALGRLVVEAHRAAHRPQREAGVALASIATQLVGYHDVPLNGRQWRTFMLHDTADHLWVMVAEREDVRGELVGKITLRSLLPDLIGLPLLAVLVWLAIGVGLRPLERMAAALKARDPDTLAPLALGALPRELEPMVTALNRLLQQVESLLEHEKRFLADAAHELRTPLAVLRIHAQNALEAPDPADRAAALQQLIGGVERSTRVVTQLLTLARLEPEVVQGAMRELDLQRWLRNELAELIPLALARGQELALEIDETADYRLSADAPSLGTLLQNLVGNAVQYTPEGGQITVSLRAEARRIGLCVADSGPGVPPEQRERLFQRFFRLESGAGAGAGLGLSIVQRIVELHGGEIRLQASPLGGLQIEVWLPRHLHASADQPLVAH
ncbi:ATP-binding protein [Pseudomonas sp. NW5]|uniref:ATP-binding protein n=1 Tax=Pseudomonas sp. NW5 TaxID=2934934 RepID=UPI002020D16A|nr:ATP-binding protein [Pseudomonas sp. NW5]MCL7461570.1 ATP-binding protein [Pseudomonas sp. NW5]